MTVGRILPLQPDDDASELRFVSKDPATLRIGNFVYYNTRDGDTESRVLCRIMGRSNLESPPESYYASPAHHPGTLLEFIGAPQGILDDFVVRAKIVGRKQGHAFRAPRTPPPVGGEVFLAEDKYLEECINKVDFGSPGRQPGGLHIGHVLDREDRVRVILDADNILSVHMGVLASTGSGKSYLVGVILEELLSSHQRHPILVFDPHGEYAAMQDAATVLAQGGYAPVVDVRTETTIKIPFAELELDDILAIMPDINDNMVGAMAAAYRDWDSGGVRTRQAFMAAIQALTGGSNPQHEATVQAIARRFIASILNKPYFVDGQGEDLRNLLRPGCMTILNLSNIGNLDQEAICTALMSLVLKARRLTKTGQLQDRPFFDLPYPVCLVVEEAHRIAPPDGQKRSGKILATIMAEGRKMGVSAIIVTQRPGKVDSNVLSQALTLCVGRILNPVDRQNIAQSAEAATEDLMALLPALGQGEAVIFGQGITTPVIAAVRKRKTSVGGGHGSPTKDALAAYKTTQAEVKPVVGSAPASKTRTRI